MQGVRGSSPLRSTHPTPRLRMAVVHPSYYAKATNGCCSPILLRQGYEWLLFTHPTTPRLRMAVVHPSYAKATNGCCSPILRQGYEWLLFTHPTTPRLRMTVAHYSSSSICLKVRATATTLSAGLRRIRITP